MKTDYHAVIERDVARRVDLWPLASTNLFRQLVYAYRASTGRGKLSSNERPAVLTDFEWHIVQTLLRVERTGASAIARELSISPASAQQALRLIDRTLGDAEAGRINPARSPKVPKPAPPPQEPQRFVQHWTRRLSGQRPESVSETAWNVASYAVAHPDTTSREIAQAVGLCHQRASQILASLDPNCRHCVSGRER
jgi:hypothetical protein